MKAIDVATMREIDRMAIESYGIPSVVLMDHAAQAVKQHLDTMTAKHKKITIFCGPGNNGGDGFALARLLHQDHYTHVELFCSVEKEQQSADEAIFSTICERLGIPCYTGKEVAYMEHALTDADLIIDALFGTGLSRAIEGYYADVITCINQASVPVISIDIASGIHGDSGQVMQVAVQATETISFACYKMGLLRYPGSRYCGKISIKDIGLPHALLQQATGITIIDDDLMKQSLPIRKDYSHKGTFGKVLMIGGSMQMGGAITLAAKATLKSGVGTLTLAIPEGLHQMIAQKLEECMILPLPMEDGYLAKESCAILKKELHKYDTLVIGNGMGRTPSTLAIVDMLLQQEIPCILDGDAIYLASDLASFNNRKAPVLLTPHIKEMSYLCHTSVSDIQEHPFAILDTFIKQHPEATVVLKDAYTIIQASQERYMNIVGNHALAKGGSGDVLCGILTGMYAQCKDPLASSICAVYAHAKAADQLIKKKSAYSILPSDIIEVLSSIYKTYEKRSML